MGLTRLYGCFGEDFSTNFPIGSYVKTMSTDDAIMDEPRGQQTQFGPKDHFTKVWFQLAMPFQMVRFFNVFPIGSYVETMSAVRWWPSWMDFVAHRCNSRKKLSKDHSTKVYSQLVKWFQARFFPIFPIGSYLKLCLLMTAILDKCQGKQIQIWKGWPSSFKWEDISLFFP